MNDFIFTFNERWIGNYGLSAVGLMVLFYCAGKRDRPAWLAGAAISAALFVLLFIAAVILEHGYVKPRDGAMIRMHFSGQVLLTWFSAMPIQKPCNWLLGEDNFVEEHLMIPTALIVWGAAGAALGALCARFGMRTGKPDGLRSISSVITLLKHCLVIAVLYLASWTAAYALIYPHGDAGFHPTFCIDYLKFAWTFRGGELPAFIWLTSMAVFLPLAALSIFLLIRRDRGEPGGMAGQ